MSILSTPGPIDMIFDRFMDTNYVIRGAMRINGEKIGLPQSVKPERKMDYGVRDYFMCCVTAFTNEVAFRLAEHIYVRPQFLDLLRLNQLEHVYENPKSLHYPDFLKASPNGVKNITKELPDILRKHMLGSLVSSKSYTQVPDLIEYDEVPKIQAQLNRLILQKAPMKKIAQKRSELLQSKLWAHHLRLALSPEEYMKEFLLGEPEVIAGRLVKPRTPARITQDEYKLLTRKLKQLDRWCQLFLDARLPISEEDAFSKLLTQNDAESRRVIDFVDKHYNAALKQLRSKPNLSATEKKILDLLNQHEADRLNGFRVVYERAQIKRKGLEAHTLLKKLDDLVWDHPEARHVYNVLKERQARFSRIFKPRTTWDFVVSDLVGIKTLFKNIIRERSLVQGVKTTWEFRQLNKSSYISQLRQSETKPFNKCYRLLQRLVKGPNPISDSQLLLSLSKKSKSDVARMMHGPAANSFMKDWKKYGWQKAVQLFKESRAYAPDKIFHALSKDAFRRVISKNLVNGTNSKKLAYSQKILDLFINLGISKTKLKELSMVFDSSQLWLKFPMSVLLYFIVFGLVTTQVDNLVIQPYQRKIVKERGDVTEYTGPQLLGIFPGALAFGLLYKNPWVKKMGHLGSFVFAGLGGLGTFAASTWLMFQAKISKPRQQQVKTPHLNPIPPVVQKPANLPNNQFFQAVPSFSLQPLSPYISQPMSKPTTMQHYMA